MTFELTLRGDSAADLLAALQQLNVPDALRPQNGPAAPQEKPKAPAPAKQKKAAQKPAAAPAEKQPEPEADAPANPTAPAAPADASDAATSAPPATGGTPAAPAATTATTASSKHALEDIRGLVFALMRAGKTPAARAVVEAACTDTEVKSVSNIPPERYTEVWEKLLRLKDEVDANATD